MRKFEYKQVNYNEYPVETDLNKEGINGWEIVDIFYFKDAVFDDDEYEYVLEDKIKVTFKREINEY